MVNHKFHSAGDQSQKTPIVYQEKCTDEHKDGDVAGTGCRLLQAGRSYGHPRLGRQSDMQLPLGK